MHLVLLFMLQRIKNSLDDNVSIFCRDGVILQVTSVTLEIEVPA